MINTEKYKYIFLDRDGVINVERKNDYVKSISEMIFEENALEAISILTKEQYKIYVITNQRGVGRGIMSNQDLDLVHNFMLSQIVKSGGQIERIYYCTDTDPFSINRKPNIGMAFQAQNDYPQIDFQATIMVGNSRSDIEFSKKMGMFTVLVGNKYPQTDKIYQIADAHFANLYEFALSLR